jgi:hypothetical protein
MSKPFKALVVILVVVIVLFLFSLCASMTSCSSKVDRFLDTKYPGCQHHVVKEDDVKTTYQIVCPGQPPFETTVRRN